MANIVTKILTWAGFRVMSTWFAQYIQVKLIEPLTKAQAIADQTVKQAQAIADQTVKQAQAIADSFSIVNVGMQANVEEIVNAFAADQSAQSLTVIQQWIGESEPTEHTVYRHIMYIGG